MIDSQAQLRSLIVIVFLIFVVIVPAMVGLAFSEPRDTDFTVRDQRGSSAVPDFEELAKDSDGRDIFLTSPEQGQAACEAGGRNCPSLNAHLVVVRTADSGSPAEVLRAAYGEDLVVTGRSWNRTATITEESFNWKIAVPTGTVFLVGVVVALASLAGRARRRASVMALPRQAGPPPVIHDHTPTGWIGAGAPSLARREEAPVRPRPVPVLQLADLPGVREVLHEHGAAATARSHIGGAGGYVALGDVLVWATPVTGAAAIYPEDDVRVTVAERAVPATPPLDGGPP